MYQSLGRLYGFVQISTVAMPFYLKKMMIENSGVLMTHGTLILADDVYK